MAVVAQYESKPLDCFERVKGLRRQFAKELWASQHTGELVMLGQGTMRTLAAGLGRVHIAGGFGPNFGRIADDLSLLTRCVEAAEQLGYGSSICPSAKLCLGASALGLFKTSLRTGERIVPAFSLEAPYCEPQAKTGQLLHEKEGVPHFSIEVPPRPQQAPYFISQMNEAIEWMQKVTGRKYQDELLIESVKNEWESRVLWSRICELQKTIPAPLDQRMLYSITMVAWAGGRDRPENAELLRMVLDEAKDRVANRIAAVSIERRRLIHEGAATWFRSEVLRYPQKRYGAVFVGSYQCFSEPGAWVASEDGSWEVAPTLEQLGLELRTRGDALDALAKLHLEYDQRVRGFYLLEKRSREVAKVAEDWHVDGVIFHNDVGCKGTTMGNLEAALAVRGKGIRTMFYEESCVNPKEFNEPEYMSRVDAFMETL